MYVFSNQEHCLIHLEFSIRLREYEVDVDNSTRHGPEVERIYFLILEMARKSCSPCAIVYNEAYTVLLVCYGQNYELKYFCACWDFLPCSSFSFLSSSFLFFFPGYSQSLILWLLKVFS